MSEPIKEVALIMNFHAGYNIYHKGDVLPVKKSSNSNLLLVYLTETSIMTLNEMMTLGYIEKTDKYRNN